MSSAARRHQVSRTVAARAVAACAILGVAAALVTACQPEPAPTTSPRATTSATPAATPDEPTPAPTETTETAAGFAVPERCEDLYSADMLASLNAQNPPLNDPGVTMDSTQTVAALELLASGIPTLRCSWGRPSESGLATNVSVLDAARAAVLLDALRAQGFGCQSVWGGTLCEIEQRTVNLDDQEVTLGESHFVRDQGWVSTRRINFAPAGYTEDIVATLWG